MCVTLRSNLFWVVLLPNAWSAVFSPIWVVLSLLWSFTALPRCSTTIITLGEWEPVFRVQGHWQCAIYRLRLVYRNIEDILCLMNDNMKSVIESYMWCHTYIIIWPKYRIYIILGDSLVPCFIWPINELIYLKHRFNFNMILPSVLSDAFVTQWALIFCTCTTFVFWDIVSLHIFLFIANCTSKSISITHDCPLSRKLHA